tara:strand:+ start:2830 stop:3681 length:852 start_codon:yes stop_codon:yes gene_type:complete
MDYLIEFPELSVATLRSIKKSIDVAFKDFSKSYGDSIESFFEPLLYFMIWFEKLLTLTPWPITLFCFSFLTYFLTKNIKLSAIVILYFLFIGLFGLWTSTMYTISLVFVSTLISIALGIPIGIILAKSNSAQKIINPILDVMQTIPIFVYLIPVVMLLGLGRIPGVIAMCVYAIPPIIRLTNLGIRQVEKGMKEAATSLGLSKLQTLWSIELPLSKKSILVGINQTIMMTLSMVVIASMIGVQGLGYSVLQAVQNQYIGSGLINGFAIVGLAILLDRIIQNEK